MENGNSIKPEKLGIKETKELIIGVNELALILLILLLDGLQLFKDIRQLINHIKDNDEFREKIQVAVDNIKMVPAEVGDIDSAEIVELIGAQIPYVPKLLAAIKEGRKKLPEANTAEVAGPSSQGN